MTATAVFVSTTSTEVYQPQFSIGASVDQSILAYQLSPPSALKARREGGDIHKAVFRQEVGSMSSGFLPTS